MHHSSTSRRGYHVCFVLLLSSMVTMLGLLLTGCQGLAPQGDTYLAQVQQVLTGNTLEVTGIRLQAGTIQPDNQGKRLKVRLIGVNAPAVDQAPWGTAAKDFLEDRLIFNAGLQDGTESDRSVRLEIDTQSQDSYDRLLAYLWKDDQLINREIVAQGYALTEFYFPNVRYETELANAQHEARLLGVGIWDVHNPLRQTPQEFWQQRQGS